MMKRQTAILQFTLILILQLACGGSSSSDGVGSAPPAPHFKPGINIFTPEQDIVLGKESAAKVARQIPLLNDQQIVGYVRQLGAKLTAHAPGYKFPYQFNVVATRDINAFALPGGFIFVNAGAIAAAKNEGELAGVMAHEISHVALRHPTSQVTKVYIAQKGLDFLHSLGGGREHPDTNEVGNSIGGLGANILFLKFGRAAERQADLEGAQIMAASGYDPRDLANFFETLQKKRGQRMPEFLSDHPDPGNRIQSIQEELPSLRTSANPIHDTKEFEQIKARLLGGAANTASTQPERTGPRNPNDVKQRERPVPPDASSRKFQTPDNSFALQYPQNWDALVADNSNMIFAPKGAYGQIDKSLVVTHGIFIGAIAPQSNDLAAAARNFVEQQVKTNPEFRVTGDLRPINLNGRQGFAAIVSGPSTVTGVTEVDTIYTTATSDGRLFYLITIAPEDELKVYQPAFEQIVGSVRLSR